MITCVNCGAEFAGKRGRKYCCRDCYLAAGGTAIARSARSRIVSAITDPFPLHGEPVCAVELPKGRLAIIDAADVALVRGRRWKATSHGYVVCRGQYLHRLILGAPKGQIVDHANGDKLDNRRSNLRFCTVAQNLVNSAPRRSGKRSAYKGVCWIASRNRWGAQIQVNGRRIGLGFHRDELAAARAYDAAALRYYGEFARPNFPQGDAGGVPSSP